MNGLTFEGFAAAVRGNKRDKRVFAGKVKEEALKESTAAFKEWYLKLKPSLQSELYSFAKALQPLIFELGTIEAAYKKLPRKSKLFSNELTKELKKLSR